MAKLTTKKRNNLKDSTFALPAQREYPLDTRNRAANAKSRASQQYAKGNLSASQKATIDRKANAKLGKTGKSKSK